MKAKYTVLQKFLHLTFHINILLKGFYASIEFAAGFVLFFMSPRYIVDSITYFTQNILYKNPESIIALYIESVTQDFTMVTQHFIALYFIFHGGVKLCVVIGILLKKMWAYPSAIFVFSMFFVYLTVRYAYTHSLFLLVLALFEMLVVLLTWNEYIRIKKELKVSVR